MKQISLIMPFRERLDLLHGLMISLEETTNNLDNIELLCAIDSDDEIVLSEVNKLMISYKKFNLNFFIVNRSEHFIRDYWNFLARQANGRWIMAVNDDARFMTKDWDKIILNKMNTFAIKDDCWCGLIKDGIPRHGEDPLFPHFSSWAFQSKEAVKVMGYFYNEKCWVWGPDHFVPQLYKPLNRIVSLTEVFIDHLRMHKDNYQDKKYTDNFNRMLKIDQEHPHGITENDIKIESKKLRKYIEDKK